jgi:hypothetical protein
MAHKKRPGLFHHVLLAFPEGEVEQGEAANLPPAQCTGFRTTLAPPDAVNEEYFV